MDRIYKRNWNFVLLGIVAVIFVAGLVDIKYKGRFFQLLPERIQGYLTK